MAVLDRPTPVPSGPDVAAADELRGRRRAWRAVAGVAIVVEGAGTAVLVARHGTPGLQVARAVLVVALTGGALALAGRGGRWWPGVGKVVFGLLGTVIGAGVGAAHLLKGVGGSTTVAGMAVLAAGLVLLAGGTAQLVHRARRWWRLLAVPVAYVVLEFGAMPVTMGVYATNVPHQALGTRTPASYGLRYAAVALRATDGVPLSGWYMPSSNGAAVVVVAGSGSNRDAVLPEGAALAEHGYGVLLLDNRGHGGSGGDANDFGWYGDQDLGGAVTWLQGRADVIGGRIAVLGESMGGEEAIGAIGADPRIRAVVGEGVTGRVVADRAWSAGGAAGAMTRAEAWVTYTTAGLLSGAAEPPSLRASLRAAAPRPVLLIAGRDEGRAARYFENSSPGNVQVLELADTAHTAGLQTHPALWTARVVGFLDRSLGVRR